MISLQSPCGRLQARVNPRGAELQSLQREGQELLWQPQAGVWHQTAPWLFPFIGRLRGGGFTHRGRRFALPLHGFAAQADFKPLGDGRFQLTRSAATLAVYPFAFRLCIAYRLDAQGLHIDIEVSNDGAEPMPFAFGGHPGFALPGLLSDWALHFQEPEADTLWRLQPEPPPWGLRANAPEPFGWTAPGVLALHADLFERDALILDPVRSGWVALHHRERGQQLRVNLDGAPQLGLWARPGAPYVCIEPWWGRDDDANAPEALADKPQLQTLAPGASWQRRLQILLP